MTDLPKVLLDVNPEVRSDILENPVELSTDIILSCDFGRMMSELSSDQKDVIKNLYKFVRKIVQESSHIEFLNESLKHKFISKRFIIQNRLPGNQNSNRSILNEVSFNSIQKEKERHENVLKWARKEFEKYKRILNSSFDHEQAKKEIKRIEAHKTRIEVERSLKVKSKMNYDSRRYGLRRAAP